MVLDNDIIISIPIELWSRICYAYIAAYYKYRDQLRTITLTYDDDKFNKFVENEKYVNETYNDIYYWICDYFTFDKLDMLDNEKTYVEVSMNDLHHIRRLITELYGARDFDNIVSGKDICV